MNPDTPFSLQLLKQVASLKLKKNRLLSGQLLVEGLHPVEEALQAGLEPLHLFSVVKIAGQPERVLSQLNQMTPFNVGALHHQVSASEMSRMATTDSPPPWLGVFRQAETEPQQNKPAEGAVVVLLDGLQAPGNVGTIIRSACALGADALVLTGDSAEPYSPKVIRASSGLVFKIPVWQPSAKQVLQWLQETVAPVFLTTGQPEAKSYRKASYAQGCILLFGNEGAGVNTAWYQNIQTIQPVQPITIPTSPEVESLNVAMSAAIILAEVYAQKQATCLPDTVQQPL
jgi:RNA methyltransferase, TrmH family